MFKGRIKWIFLVYIAIVALIVVVSPKEIEWQDSFEHTETIPYGCAVFYQELDHLFEEPITYLEEAIYTEYDYLPYDSSAYIFITNDFIPDELDLNILLDYVYEGNQVFISANFFNYNLLDTLGVNTDYLDWSYLSEDTLQIQMDTLSKDYFNFVKSRGLLYFANEVDSISRFTSYAYERNSKAPIMIGKRLGAGIIYLHSFPYAFTNFHMLEADNYQFAAHCISALPSDYTIHWDNYYKPSQGYNRKPELSTFIEHKEFRWAFGIGLAILILFMLFRLKRTQRSIPIIKPYKNSGVELAQTIGDLYLEYKDNQDLAQKMQRHFKETLMQKYRMYNVEFTDVFLEQLVKKSGKGEGLISTIFTLFQRSESQSLDDQSILLLSQKLSKFYQNKSNKDTQ